MSHPILMNKICYINVPWRSEYLCVKANNDEHEEEHDGPQLTQGELTDGLRVHNERKTRPCNTHAQYMPPFC